jgi:hypothetical protein
MTDASTPENDLSGGPTTSRWKLLSSTLRAQRKNLIIGSIIGLCWMIGKITVPILVRFSIDKGIEQGEMLWLWSLLIGGCRVARGVDRAAAAWRRSVACRRGARR